MSIEQNTKILASDVVKSLSEKSPTSHASNDITYGVGTDTDYGHVKLSDAIDSDSDKSAGIASSPKAVSTLASVILEAAKNASEGSDGENEIYELLQGEVKHEIGSWWFSIDGSIPTGGLPHLGHLVSRSTYGTGWTWIEMNKTVVSDEDWLAYAESHNGTCPYYSYGDGSTTFRTPKYDQSFLKVLATIGGTGEMQEAGLPYFGGSIQGVVTDGGYGTGIFNFQQTTIENLSVVASGAKSAGTFTLTPPSVYGNSDTVTPQNYGIIVGIYVVGAVSAPIGETDAANLLNGLSTLETQVAGCVRSVNGTSASAAGDVDIAELAAGWSRPASGSHQVNISVQSANTDFIAPTHGYVTFDVQFSTSNNSISWAQIYNRTSGILDYEFRGANVGGRAKLYVPVAKGDNVRFQWDYIDYVVNAVFIPCIGCV